MTNPLLTAADLPAYAAIRPAHIEPAIDHWLAENRAEIERLLAANAVYGWDNLIRPLEELEDRLNKTWSPVNHLHSVCDSEDLRAAYNACLPKLSAYYSELGQHEALYRAYRQIAEGPEYARIDPAQRKVITDALRDFRLSGIALPPEQQARHKEIQRELTQLGAKFSENVLDATQGWTKLLTDAAQLAGLPESARALARQAARQRGLDGWLVTLELPSYLPVLNYADDRELRRELYGAYCTRASDQGPNGGQWDNGPVMERILALRLNWPNYSASTITPNTRSPPRWPTRRIKCWHFSPTLPTASGPRRGANWRNCKPSPASGSGWTTCKPGTSAITRKSCARTAIDCRRRSCGPTSRCPGS